MEYFCLLAYGGSIRDWGTPQSIFGTPNSRNDCANSIFDGAAFSFVVFVFSFVRPRSIYANVLAEQLVQKPNLKALVRHLPIYPALTIWLLWNFAPGSITPLQFFLQNRLGASDIQWGIWNASFVGSFIPAFVLYGFLSHRVSFKALLWSGTLVAIPQFVPLLFVKTLNQGLYCAVPIGLMGGIATAAYLGPHHSLMPARTSRNDDYDVGRHLLRFNSMR